MGQVDWKAVAGRIQGLITPTRQDAFATTARRLGVEERQLRDAISGMSRVSVMPVLASVARLFGLDPTWLLTGRYDSSTHRVALQGNTEEISAMIRDIANAPDDLERSAEVRIQHSARP